MYFCSVNGNCRVTICTLSSAHWQQASKRVQPCGALSWFGKIEINAPINTIIIITIIIIIILIIIKIIIIKIKTGSLENLHHGPAGAKSIQSVSVKRSSKDGGNLPGCPREETVSEGEVTETHRRPHYFRRKWPEMTVEELTALTVSLRSAVHKMRQKASWAECM